MIGILLIHTKENERLNKSFVFFEDPKLSVASDASISQVRAAIMLLFNDCKVR
jgi:hypothetical protein